MSPPQKHVCVLEARKAGERRWDERSQRSYHFFLFNYCYYYWNTKREPLRRREARGTRKRNAKWLGCGRSGLALFAGSHRSPLEENSSLEPTLCQGVAVPSVFFVFFLSGKGSATYAKLPSFYASILSFYANPNTDIYQWSKLFYLQYPFVMNMYFVAFRFFKWQGWFIDSNSFGSLPSLEVCLSGLSKTFKKVLRLGYPRADVPGYTLKGVYYHAQIEQRVSMVDKKKVDSLLLIPQNGMELNIHLVNCCSPANSVERLRHRMLWCKSDLTCLWHFTRRNGTSDVS